MKTIKHTFICIFFMLCIFSRCALADAVGYIRINAFLPDDFYGQVDITFLDSEGNKKVTVLSFDNQYSLTKELPVGKYVLDSIYFYNKDGSPASLKYETNGSIDNNGHIIISESSKASFNIVVHTEYKPDDDNDTTKNEATDTNQKEQNKQEEKEEEIKSVSQDENKEAKPKATPSVGNILINSTNKWTIINFIIDFILLAGVGGIYIYLKFKNKKGEDND